MKIRPITQTDLPACIRLGGRMHEESVYNYLEYSPEKCYEFGINALENDKILWLVAEIAGEVVGMLGASIQEIYFADGLVANDYLVYVVPEKRGSSVFYRLVKAYQEWADEKGALAFMSVSNGNFETEDLFSRLGCERMGGVFKLEELK